MSLPCRLISLLLLGLALLVVSANGVGAQESQKPALPPTPSEPKPAKTPGPAQGVVRSREFGSVTFSVSQNVEVVLDNRTTGSIKVTGWDRDVISTRAVSERGRK